MTKLVISLWKKDVYVRENNVYKTVNYILSFQCSFIVHFVFVCVCIGLHFLHRSKIKISAFIILLLKTSSRKKEESNKKKLCEGTKRVAKTGAEIVS